MTEEIVKTALIRMDSELYGLVFAYKKEHGYTGMSAAIKQIIREHLGQK